MWKYNLTVTIAACYINLNQNVNINYIIYIILIIAIALHFQVRYVKHVLMHDVLSGYYVSPLITSGQTQKTIWYRYTHNSFDINIQ